MNRLIDADKLSEEVLKWLPPDPCGQEEKEYPFETDIVVSMMMTIEEAETVEAIPIDWLNQRIETLAETGGLLANLGAALVMKMVEEWKQEQKG